jgi:transcriptional regulator with XRE-family HTH domain
LTPADVPYHRQASALIELRQRYGLSKYHVIKQSGIAKPVYYDMEAGTRQATPESLDRLARVYSDEDMKALRDAAAIDHLAKRGVDDPTELWVKDMSSRIRQLSPEDQAVVRAELEQWLLDRKLLPHQQSDPRHQDERR